MQKCPNCQAETLVTIVTAVEKVSVDDIGGNNSPSLVGHSHDFFTRAIFDDSDRPLVKCPECETVYSFDYDKGLLPNDIDDLPDLEQTISTSTPAGK